MGPAVRRALSTGAIGGFAAIYLCLVGLVEAFEERNIVTGWLGLGLLLLVIVALGAGVRAGSPMRGYRGVMQPLRPATALGAGALAGGVAGVMLGALLLLIGAVNLQFMLSSASPRLIDILSVSDEPVVSAALLVVGFACLAVLGAALNLLPATLRRIIVTTAVFVFFVSLLEPIVRVMLVQLEERAPFLPFAELAGFLYERGGLTPVATIVLLVATPIVLVAWSGRDRLFGRFAASPGAAAEDIEELESDAPETSGRRRIDRRTVWGWAGWALIGIGLILAPQILGVRLSEVIGTVGLYVLLGLGLNIVVGYAGLLDLGYVAFFAVGAYVTAVLTSPGSPAFAPQISFWAALPVVMIAAACVGLLIGAPVLRLRGDYLAIVTLGFGEIARILFLSDWLKPWVGGAQGILQIPAPDPIGRDPQSLYYPIVAFCVLAAICAWSLYHSRVGRAWTAMREDEEVAEATGINTTKYKLLAFASGAVFGCIGGAFFAVKVGSVFPHSFDIEVSINALAIVILGGIGSIPGVIVGAAVLVGLPELLREFAEYRVLIYGAVLVAMMLLRPEGLIPNRARRAELHEHEEDEEDQGVDLGTHGSPGGAPVVSGGST